MPPSPYAIRAKITRTLRLTPPGHRRSAQPEGLLHRPASFPDDLARHGPAPPARTCHARRAGPGGGRGRHADGLPARPFVDDHAQRLLQAAVCTQQQRGRPKATIPPGGRWLVAAGMRVPRGAIGLRGHRAGLFVLPALTPGPPNSYWMNSGRAPLATRGHPCPTSSTRRWKLPCSISALAMRKAMAAVATRPSGTAPRTGG